MTAIEIEKEKLVLVNGQLEKEVHNDETIQKLKDIQVFIRVLCSKLFSFIQFETSMLSSKEHVTRYGISRRKKIARNPFSSSIL